MTFLGLVADILDHFGIFLRIFVELLFASRGTEMI